jgi:hypothetical protein
VFAFEYELGTTMKVVVSIFDDVSKGDDKGRGSAVFNIGAIVGARGNTRAKKSRVEEHKLSMKMERWKHLVCSHPFLGISTVAESLRMSVNVKKAVNCVSK